MPLNFLWNNREQNIRFAIFDLDGTLLDTMGYWRNLGVELLEKRGLKGRAQRISVGELSEEIYAQTGERILPFELWQEGMELMRLHYEKDAVPKPYALEYLQLLSKNKIPFCIATMTDRELCMPALERFGIASQMEFLLTCTEAGAEKDRPDIYLQSAEKMGASPFEAMVYEDSLFCAKTALSAGFPVTGVYDEWESEQDILKEICTLYIKGFENFPLYCPKCKRETIISVTGQNVVISNNSAKEETK